MIVNVTWFLWLALYASTNRLLNSSVAERTHMVSWVPSSGTVLVGLDELLHATALNPTTSTAATEAMRRRRGVPVGPAAVPGAMSSPLEVDRKPFRPYRKVRLRLSATLRLRTGHVKA